MKEILEYQRLEIELNKLRKSSVDNQEKEVMNQMINYVRDAQGKSTKLENDAAKLVNDYANLKSNYNQTSDKVSKLLKKDVNKMSADEINTTFAEINKLSSDLFMLERKLNFIITNSKNLLKQFEVTRNNVKKARAKHKESKEKYESIQKSYEPKIAEVEKQLKALEGKIDKTILAKYRTLKNDNIFPVFVPLMGNACGGCRMNIATGKLANITKDGYITCEHCGRIIYNQK